MTTWEERQAARSAHRSRRVALAPPLEHELRWATENEEQLARQEQVEDDYWFRPPGTPWWLADLTPREQYRRGWGPWCSIAWWDDRADDPDDGLGICCIDLYPNLGPAHHQDNLVWVGAQLGGWVARYEYICGGKDVEWEPDSFEWRLACPCGCHIPIAIA